MNKWTRAKLSSAIKLYATTKRFIIFPRTRSDYQIITQNHSHFSSTSSFVYHCNWNWSYHIWKSPLNQRECSSDVSKESDHNPMIDRHITKMQFRNRQQFSTVTQSAIPTNLCVPLTRSSLLQLFWFHLPPHRSTSNITKLLTSSKTVTASEFLVVHSDRPPARWNCVAQKQINRDPTATRRHS